MKKATTPALLHLKNGVIVEDWAAQAAILRESDPKPVVKLNLRELEPLKRDREKIVERIADRKAFVSQQAPFVSELRRKATIALEELNTLTEALKSGEFDGGMRQAVHQKKREADRLETAWAAESKALERAETILTSQERTLKEWDAANGERLKKLRKLDAAIDSSRPSSYRGSGLAQEVMLDAAQGRQ